MRKLQNMVVAAAVVLLASTCLMGCGSKETASSAQEDAMEESAAQEEESEASSTDSDAGDSDQGEAQKEQEAEAASAPKIEDHLTVDGAYWRNAFENDDYSEFADDEERELFVFMTLSPAEDDLIYMTSLGAQLEAGTQTLQDSLYLNFGNSYYQSMKDAGYKCLPSTSTGIKPYEDPVKYVAQFFVEGWMVKNAESVTLKASYSIGQGNAIEGTIDIPLEDIRPVMVDVEGQPTHPAMIEEMVRMSQE